ncbi:MAG: RNA-binding domain-containing protein [Rhodothermales bacterium]
MKLEELSRLVLLGEGLTLEFKTKVPKAERIAKEVIAFANTSGGRLLLGVDDDGTIKGVRDSSEEEYALTEALGAHCAPPVEFTSERIPVSNKRNVILVRVPSSSRKPHKLVSADKEASGTVYVRVEDMSVEASREHVRLMNAKKKQDNVVFEFGEKEKVLMRYLENYGRITVAQFAKLVNIPARRASHTLVLLTKANVLQLHPGAKTDYFTLAYGE